MAGAFDFMVIIEGKTMRQVAQFVSDKLAPLDSVLSTATHFVLKNTRITERYSVTRSRMKGC